MADLSEFSDEAFNPRAWINNSCSQKPADEPLEKYLAELEMRLQLTAEEIESTLQDHSTQALRRIPFAVQEIYRLQGDIQGMQDQVRVMATEVARGAAVASESVSKLSELDKVKNNMESACSTLKEATELSGLFIKVEEVFAAGDLPKVAEMLSSMRRSLSLVGDVPEFRAGRQKLRGLEDRLQSMIEGSLAEALTKGQDEEAVKRLCALLLAVDRYSTIEHLYCNSRLSSIHAAWEELSAKGAAASSGGAAPAQSDAPTSSSGPFAWLQRFFSHLATFLENENSWCARVLPGHHLQLMTSLTNAALTKVSKGTKERLAGSLTGPGSIPILAALQRDLVVLAKSIAELLKDHDIEARQQVLRLVYEPLEDRVSSYGSLEQVQLKSEVDAALPASYASPSSLNSEDTDALLRKLSTSAKAVFASLQGAVERCLSFTGGTELRGLLKAVDHELSGFISRQQSCVQVLHERHNGTRSSSAGLPSSLGHGDDGEELGSTLKLLLLLGELSSGMMKVEALCRTTIANTVPKLEAAAQRGQSAPADPVVLRLVSQPEGLRRAQQLAANLAEPRYILLRSATSALEALGKAVHSTVLDALLAKVKYQLRLLPDMPEWKKDIGASPVALPSFNAYPLAYVTSIGEYLMTMPQQLEVLMVEDAQADVSGVASDGEELAAEWLDKVVSGAASLYSEQVMRIPELSVQGGVQLAADVEYFCNVMSALQVMPPASLLTMQLFAGQPSDQFVDAALAALGDGSADGSALRTLAGMRKLTLPSVTAAPVSEA
mmetsp:Transcript_8936/g.19078  ORF Transcript_8936/g.19078 Transcript_8936/m.19078 type:complete len:778 (+) Transcript_8936:63-2396(+)|eukprot:CAMPEP_0202894158 /NCGR_PEP_ID=MMETSP1392-20130828/3605_1 /ASSEMBLY_ACC=CAM_ASM_000868 /TAXON_ID=225041 /ORGANISM="Chlamydomonas chlamydogama, Strain SAG 11-48b" /LENGTH=777 /DNA_ID=CAMNT_0049578753 /DNA_START=37 /DNA_END=2370 /DNA_ORIENTATION=-